MAPNSDALHQDRSSSPLCRVAVAPDANCWRSHRLRRYACTRGKGGACAIYLDNLRIRHVDGGTTPLWSGGEDTRAGRFPANELLKDLQIRTVDVAEAGK